MSYDFLTMTAVSRELNELAVGARIQRIYQPRKDEIIIYLYRRGEQFGLLLSANPAHARVHLTRQRYRHLDQPTPFCMLLRKYLIGGSISCFRQLPLERVLEISFQAPEGLPETKLMAEIMGRRSNMILVDRGNSILGAVKTAYYTQNPQRPILPGEPYLPVPPQDKANPVTQEKEALIRNLLPSLQDGLRPHEALVKNINGISPLLARELAHRVPYQATAPIEGAGLLINEMKKLFAAVLQGENSPEMYPNENTYASYPLTHLNSKEVLPYQSMNKLLDYFYFNLLTRDEENRLREKLRSAVMRQMTKLEKKLSEQEKELNEAEECSHYRIYGEILLAYGSKIRRGAKEAVLPNIYQPAETVTIPLNPAWSAGDNAQKYFSRYQKAKKGRSSIALQIERTKAEIAYCQTLLLSVDQSDAASLDEIRRELVEGGFLREHRKEGKQKAALPKPATFTASSGRTILVGMNNRQNDYLTFKMAARRDTWLHVKDLPGSHVVIKDTPYPPVEDDLLEGALLAAYFSRGRDSSGVAVDYTQARHVRRGPGGRPGFVLYENYRTITVNPNDSRLQTLL